MFLREANRDRQRETRAELRAELIAAYGGKCQCRGCDVTEPEFLGLEHTKRDGKKHRAECGGAGWITYRDLQRRGWPKDGYELRCFNCNFSAGMFGGKCVHERPKFAI